jgi:hypothetical protein
MFSQHLARHTMEKPEQKPLLGVYEVARFVEELLHLRLGHSDVFAEVGVFDLIH